MRWKAGDEGWMDAQRGNGSSPILLFNLIVINFGGSLKHQSQRQPKLSWPGIVRHRSLNHLSSRTIAHHFCSFYWFQGDEIFCILFWRESFPPKLKREKKTKMKKQKDERFGSNGVAGAQIAEEGTDGQSGPCRDVDSGWRKGCDEGWSGWLVPGGVGAAEATRALGWAHGRQAHSRAGLRVAHFPARRQPSSYDGLSPPFRTLSGGRELRPCSVIHMPSAGG